jgi:hypothetical protein
MPEWVKSLRRFLWRVLSDLPASIGSNYLGVWFPLVPGALLVFYQVVQTGWATVRHDLTVGAIITTLSYALLFFYCIVRNAYREHRALTKQLKEISELVPPLQLQGLRLASEVRSFALSFGPIGPLPPEAMAQHRTALWQHFQSLIGSYPPEVDPQLRARILHGFEARKFAERVEEYMHLAGEEGYPITYTAGFTRDIFDRRSMLRLAFDIQNVAVSLSHFSEQDGENETRIQRRTRSSQEIRRGND